MRAAPALALAAGQPDTRGKLRRQCRMNMRLHECEHIFDEQWRSGAYIREPPPKGDGNDAPQDEAAQPDFDEMTPTVGVALSASVFGNQSSLAAQNPLHRTTTRELVGKEQCGNADRHRVADNHGVNRRARRRRARRLATCMRARSHESASFSVSDGGTECDGRIDDPQ